MRESSSKIVRENSSKIVRENNNKIEAITSTLLSVGAVVFALLAFILSLWALVGVVRTFLSLT